MPIYVEATTGIAVDAATATYSGGRIKPGYREVLADGEQIHFHIGMRDAAPGSSGVFLNDSQPPASEPFVSPSELRQREIMADVARANDARRITNDASMRAAIDQATAERRNGAGSPVVAALRDARSTGAMPTTAPIAARDAAPDNSATVAAVRAARYR